MRASRGVIFPRAKENGMSGQRDKGIPLGPPILLGVPFDANSSFMRGPAEAPPKIREAFRSGASNQWSETGVDVGAPGLYEDAGDMSLQEGDAFPAIEKEIDRLLRNKQRPLILGG